MVSVTERTRIRLVEWAVLIAIVALAATLRLVRLDLIEFKSDEAKAIALTAPIVDGGHWPEVGLVSSVGIHNPPVFLYLLAVPMTVSFNPRFVTGSFVGGLAVLGVLLTFVVIRPRFGAFVALSATALFACSPWAVLYARKIWAQDVLPVFLVVLLYVLFAVSERRRTWLVALVPVLVGILWQIHFSAVALVPVCAVVVLLRARDVGWLKLLVGIALAVSMLLPYLHFQRTHDWTDVRGFGNMVSGKRADGGARPPGGGLSFEALKNMFQTGSYLAVIHPFVVINSQPSGAYNHTHYRLSDRLGTGGGSEAFETLH